jgi:hypothetical protein
MNRNFTIAMVVMFAPIAIFAQSSEVKRETCKGITTKELPCKNLAIVGRTFCRFHDSTYVKTAKLLTTVCTGTKKNGEDCSLRTTHTSGLCHHHRDQ